MITYATIVVVLTYDLIIDTMDNFLRELYQRIVATVLVLPATFLLGLADGENDGEMLVFLLLHAGQARVFRVFSTLEESAIDKRTCVALIYVNHVFVSVSFVKLLGHILGASLR